MPRRSVYLHADWRRDAVDLVKVSERREDALFALQRSDNSGCRKQIEVLEKYSMGLRAPKISGCGTQEIADH